MRGCIGFSEFSPAHQTLRRIAAPRYLISFLATCSRRSSRSVGHGCPTAYSMPPSNHGGTPVLRMDPLPRLHSHVAALTSYETLRRLWQLVAPCQCQKISPPTYRQTFEGRGSTCRSPNPNTAARLPN